MIVQMTADELRQLVTDVVSKCIGESPKQQVEPADEWLKGLRGIMKVLGVNMDKASKIKNSGVIDDAIIYNGARSFIVNAAKARELWKKHTDNIRMGVA